jgi:hypothetical protein
MSLAEVLKDDSKKSAIIKDCAELVDQEVASKSGISGFAVKTGYGAVKGIKPGFINEVIEKLLPQFAEKMDPIWAESLKESAPTAHFEKNRARVADALLSVTDSKIDGAKSAVVKKTYSTLRGSAKKNVEEAVPRLAKLLDKYAR